MVETLMRLPTREVADLQTQHTELRAMLYEALGLEPEEFPASLPTPALESAEGMILYGTEQAERVADHWARLEYRPDPNTLLAGLVEFSIQTGNAVKTAMPELEPAEIEERMKELGIRIRGMVTDSEGRRRNLRTDRDLFANLYRRKLSMMWAREDSNL